jgi:L-fuconolactonase
MSRRIDSHHHLWDPTRAAYPWMTHEVDAIRRPFGIADLAPELAAAGIDATVVVQARTEVAETRDLLGVAAATPLVAGVVGWLDLADPAIASALAAWQAGPGGEWLVALRHPAHDEVDPGWLEREDVGRGVAALGAAGLAFDLLVRTRELPAALALVRAHPDVRFVVDHLAKPEIATGGWEPWAGRLRALAAHEHVSCKLSGLVTEASWDGWTVDQLRPYVDLALESFGPERLLFGSDWPVCLLAASYQRVMAAAGQLIGDLSPDEQAAILGGTAARVYRLPS